MSDASKKVDEYNAMTIASVNKQVFPYPYATYDMRLGTFKFNFRGFHQLVWFYWKKSKPTKDLYFSQIMVVERLDKIHVIFDKIYKFIF